MTQQPTLWARAVEDRRWTTVLLALLCIALLAWTARQAVGGDLFRLAEVRVHGVDEEDRAVVRAFAAEVSNRYLWSIDRQRVARRVRLLPWARDVRVRYRLPNGLDIHLRRERPVAQALIEGRLVDVASGGLLVATRSAASTRPLVQGAESKAALAMAMAARASFIKVRGEEDLSEVRVHALGVSIYDRQGIEYRLGRDRFEGRLRKAERVRRGAKRLNLRVNRMILDDDRHPNRVVVRRVS